MYKEIIRRFLARHGKSSMDPRHIEAFMRLEHPTLDGLTLYQFEQEVRIAEDCIEHGGVESAESCAQSFGL